MEKRPRELEEHGDIMSNFDHEIVGGSEELLKLGKVYGYYSGWNFHGTVWFDRVFKCQVKQYSHHVATIEGDTLSEIMERVCARFGSD